MTDNPADLIIAAALLAPCVFAAVAWVVVKATGGWR